MAKAPQRVDWVDYTKGLTILLVVILHATTGVEKYMQLEGWMHEVIAFAKPFRMPVFFAVAGLFAVKTISKDWRTFIDSKLVHFAYFYILWLTIQFGFKAGHFAETRGFEGTLLFYFESFIQPFGMLWFIYMLPVYFIVLRLTKSVPVLAQFAIAIAMKAYLTNTGIGILDHFSKYYVFFLFGHFGRDLWFKLAQSAKDHAVSVYVGLAVWAVCNWGLVEMGYAELTPLSVLLGVLGFVAIVSLMAVLPRRGLAQVFAYCGERSLPIYLGFFLPMVATRITLPKLCETCDPGTASAIVAFVAVTGSIAMYEVVKRVKIGTFLYQRPDWARLKEKRSNFVPAE